MIWYSLAFDGKKGEIKKKFWFAENVKKSMVAGMFVLLMEEPSTFHKVHMDW